ncbi:MAG: hypothetical protein IIC29_03330 [Chloroflexi bacterium]|nr:hypothetical protein [Chloroflexota bacterium]
MATTARRTVTNGTGPSPGPAESARRQGVGPAIWLAGDPEDLKIWMDRGAAGIITNTIVLNQMVQTIRPGHRGRAALPGHHR